MMLVVAKYGLGMISGDIGNAFCTAHCAEKIWSMAGEQFGDKKGAIVGRSGFMDQKSKHYKGYDYIATHVDDIIIVAKNPLECMRHIEQHFQVRDVMDSPGYYLVNNIAKINGKVVISAKKYLKE
eukprot:4679137-Ditylum_brightwellii.AAC.1